MSLMKRRAEAARRKRIDHVFSKADGNSNGKITIQQMLRLFATNGEVSLSSNPISNYTILGINSKMYNVLVAFRNKQI